MCGVGIVREILPSEGKSLLSRPTGTKERVPHILPRDWPLYHMSCRLEGSRHVRRDLFLQLELTVGKTLLSSRPPGSTV